jgi:hypothetical protein
MFRKNKEYRIKIVRLLFDGMFSLKCHRHNDSCMEKIMSSILICIIESVKAFDCSDATNIFTECKTRLALLTNDNCKRQ